MSAVDEGVIAIWPGTIASIPSGWNLCDGTGSTPDLRERFVRGAEGSDEAGGTGGADSHGHTEQTAGVNHTHTLGSTGAHTHTTNAGGVHDHGLGATYYGSSSGGNQISKGLSDGSHSHTVNSGGSHTHTSGNPNAGWTSHSHTVNSSDGRPPYYEVLFIQAGTGGANLANGIVFIWTGLKADIPADWAEKTELREQFLRGAPNATDAGGTGGATTHTHTTSSEGAHTHAASDSQGNHTHTFNNDAWPHGHDQWSPNGTPTTVMLYNWTVGTHQHDTTNSTGAHTHTLASEGSHTHSPAAASSLPAYYDVVFIYCNGATELSNGIIGIWVGLIADVPSGWSRCDGTGDAPELRGKFLRGVANGSEAGGTGGSDSHTHTDGSSGSHTHTQDAFSTGHQHNETNSTGAHQHGTGSNPIAGATPLAYYGNDDSAGDHTHTFNNDAWSHTHTVSTYSTTHQHTIDSADTRPAYYEVQYIMKTSVIVEVSVSESAISVSDSVSILLRRDVQISESAISVADSPAIALTRVKSISETAISASDAASAAIVKSRAIAETAIVVVDSPSLNLQRDRSVSEAAISVADSVTPNVRREVAISETPISVADAVERGTVISKAVTESLGKPKKASFRI